MPDTNDHVRPAGFVRSAAIVLAIGGAWRLLMAMLMPVLSRDGVTFCWYARSLGEQGLEYLKDPSAQQHPLFPALLVGVQRAVLAVGAPDDPLTWQRCGQAIALVSGIAVILLSGSLARRLVQRLELPLDAGRAGICAMLLAALLPLNVWLSADVMSDQLHLALYLGAACLLVNLSDGRRTAAVGALAALAFLTRQEGVVLVLAGLAALVARRRSERAVKLAQRAVLLVGVFVICVSPYWALTGSFSSKKNIEDVFANVAVSDLMPRPAQNDALDLPTSFARLDTREVAWYALLPTAVYELFRAGRIVVPLLALPVLLQLRRRLLQPPLAGLMTCVAAHVALTLILLERFGYLQPRHMLVPTALLVPLAGMLLARVHFVLRTGGRPWLARLIVVAALLPLATYALRVPNAWDAYLRRAADRLIAEDSARRGKRMLCGASPRRVAFYADLEWQPWFEDPQAYDILCRKLRTGGAGYFAIEVAPDGARDEHFELAGNHDLITKLMADPAIAPHMKLVHSEPAPNGGALQIYSLSE